VRALLDATPTARAQTSTVQVKSGGTASVSGMMGFEANGRVSSLGGSGMWVGWAIWKLNLEKSTYRPGPMPVKSLTVIIESQRGSDAGVLAVVTGEQANGTPISASVFTPWDGRSWGNPQVTGKSPYYNTITIILGTPTTSFSVGRDTSYGPLLAFSGKGFIPYSLSNIKWNVSTSKGSADYLPSESQIVSKDLKTATITTKGTSADGKFEQVFLFER